MRQCFEALFRQHFGAPAVAIEAIAGDGSPRARLRLVAEDGRSAIGVPPGVPEEDRAFVAWTRSLSSAGLPVPALFAVDETSGACLVQDAGRRSLYDALVEARRETGEAFPASALARFQEVLRLLPRFQVQGGMVVDYGLAWPRADFDRRAMAWDLSWFKNMLLRIAEISFHEDWLEDDFEHLLDALAVDAEKHLLHRDFQARNVMLSDQGPLFIDFQNGRRGPLLYDLAAMLYSGSSNLPPAARDTLLDRYLDALSEHLPVDAERCRDRFPKYAVLRILQALGAYGYRGLHMRRPGFAARIGPAARNLREVLDRAPGAPRLPELRRIVDRILDREDLVTPLPIGSDTLTVRVGSFAYPRGLPRDPSGHGGGFVFDCRALPNPGREAPCRAFSGLDEAVATLLASTPEAGAFVARAAALVDAQVEAYLARDFRSLDVRFGCTGGQHRSVWCAERLAEHLRERRPRVRVRVEHAEAASWPPEAARP